MQKLDRDEYEGEKYKGGNGGQERAGGQDK